MSFEHIDANMGNPTDREATPAERAFGMEKILELDLEGLNAKLAERFDSTREYFDTENAILERAGEIFRMEHLLGENQDAGFMEKIVGYVVGTKEDVQRLENARMMLAQLEKQKVILAERLEKKDISGKFDA